MDLQLQGKRALVTGSTRGIGRAVATALAREGAAVAVHGRRPDDAERVAREIESDSTAVSSLARGVAGDLSSDDGAQQVFDAAHSALGGIDVLVNNAGTFEVLGWADADAGRWAETYNVNVLSMVRLVRLALPGMRQAGWGRIVQVASISASIVARSPRRSRSCRRTSRPSSEESGCIEIKVKTARVPRRSSFAGFLVGSASGPRNPSARAARSYPPPIPTTLGSGLLLPPEPRHT